MPPISSSAQAGSAPIARKNPRNQHFRMPSASAPSASQLIFSTRPNSSSASHIWGMASSGAFTIAIRQTSPIHKDFRWPTSRFLKSAAAVFYMATPDHWPTANLDGQSTRKPEPSPPEMSWSPSARGRRNLQARSAIHSPWASSAAITCTTRPRATPFSTTPSMTRIIATSSLPWRTASV